MTRETSSLCRILPIGFVVAVLLGCDGGTGPLDQDGGDADPSCGQTVSRAPSDVFVSPSFSGSGKVVSGASTGLAKALQRALVFQLDVDYSRLLYKVGDDGEVLAWTELQESDGEKVYLLWPLSGSSLDVEDGCLVCGLGPDRELPVWVRYGQLYADPICGQGRVPLWQDGVLATEGTGEQICLDGEILDHCRRCWQDENGWHQKLTHRMRFTAQGTLDSVAIVDESGQDSGERVTASSGETIVAEMTFEIGYLISPSAEEMGYRQLPLPTWP